MIYNEEFYLNWFLRCATTKKPKNIKKYNKTFQMRFLYVDKLQIIDDVKSVFTKFDISINVAPRWTKAHGMGETKSWIYLYYNEDDFKKVSIYAKLCNPS